MPGTGVRAEKKPRLATGTIVPTVPPALTPNGGFLLPLPLGAGLLIEAPLPQLGIESGTLNLPLELPEGPLEVLPLLHDHFQSNHRPWDGF